MNSLHLYKVSEVKIAQLCPTLCDPMDCPWNFPGQNTEVGSLSLLQGIFPTQESNQGLPHCRRILYQLSYQGSPEHVTFCQYSSMTGIQNCIAYRSQRVECVSEARELGRQ